MKGDDVDHQGSLIQVNKGPKHDNYSHRVSYPNIPWICQEALLQGGHDDALYKTTRCEGFNCR